MSGIGPALPPHLLAKRKRQEKEAALLAAENRSGAKLEDAPLERDAKRSRVMGPAPPPSFSDDQTNEAEDKKSHPKPHSAPSKKPSSDTDDTSDDSDDDFGPTLPSSNKPAVASPATLSHAVPAHPTPASPESSSQSKRDEWMTLPPTQDGLAARMDPSRPRPKGFNTSKGARGPNPSLQNGSSVSSWHETAQQKQQRLADEVLGKSTATAPAQVHRPRDSSLGKERERAQKERLAKEPPKPSLMDEHQRRQRVGEKEADDDPTKRAFDREKDMASGIAGLSGAKKQELLRKTAGGFAGKFASGSFL